MFILEDLTCKQHSLLLFSFLIILGILISSGFFYVVRQQSVAIVERFGRYQKIATRGFICLPFGIDKIAARIQLRLLQSEIVLRLR